MGSDRLLGDLPPPEVEAERARLQEMLMLVIDDTIVRCDRAKDDSADPVATKLLREFVKEFVTLRKHVREGATVEEFARARKPKEGRCGGDARDEAGRDRG